MSCAWPDPSHRNALEFCENGAKAITWEATPLTVPREFWVAASALVAAGCHGVLARAAGPPRRARVQAGGRRPVRADRWERAFEIIARAAQRARLARRGGVLHERPHRERGRVPLPAVRPRVRHEQPAGLLEHVPRVDGHGAERGRSASASRPIAYDDFGKADLVIVMGQNPGTNHPRMLTALEETKRNGGADRRRQPAARGGAHPLQEPAEGARPPRPGHRDRRPAAADPVGRRPRAAAGGARRVLDAEAAAPGTVLDQAFLDEHTVGPRRRSRAHLAELDEAEVLRATGLAARGDRRPRRALHRRRSRDHHAGRWASRSSGRPSTRSRRS